ncbi:MAG: hypothetical protein QOJ19_3539 [Acidimicrobiia bacterium]|jgi:hypothetical protein|nr:hypothetical protein [Acidimicrobiia bacterium]
MTEEGHRVELIRRIHDTPTLVSLAVTGGGVAAVSDLLAVPGASRTVVEAAVPYAESALVDLLGREPLQAVSPSTAIAMAEACRRRALRLMPAADRPMAGVACTAALATDRPKRGEHRAHVAACTDAGSAVWSLVLTKGMRDRSGEDRLVSDLVLAVVAVACGLDGMQLVHLDHADALTPPG